jgi:hypothetical protein
MSVRYLLAVMPPLPAAPVTLLGVLVWIAVVDRTRAAGAIVGGRIRRGIRA